MKFEVNHFTLSIEKNMHENNQKFKKSGSLKYLIILQTCHDASELCHDASKDAIQLMLLSFLHV